MNFRLDQNRLVRLKKGWLLAAACLAMAVTLSCSLATRFLPKVQQHAGSNAPLGLITYVGTDGNIYTIDRQGKQSKAITQDADLSPAAGGGKRIYQYPTWAPNGQSLAFMGFSGTTQADTQASLYTATSDGNNLVEAFSSQAYFPFYLFWSPNSEYVTFLSNAVGGGGLALHMAAASGGNSKVLGTGQPFYWDWSPDSQAIIVHTGGSAAANPEARMAFFMLDGAVQKKELELKPAIFQAPAWSPAGEELVLAAESSAGGTDLILAGRDGNVKRVLAQLSGPVAFAWSPDGSNLGYTIPVEGDPTGLLRHLIVLDPAHPDNSKEVAQGIVLAFFWSPDNQKIASFILSPENPGGDSQSFIQSGPRFNLGVQVYDLQSGDTKQVATFEPTDSFKQVLPFFDQYQRSGTIWSPDSKNLVLSAIDNNGSPGILVAGIDGGPLQKIADGDLAFWSWK